jgi:hypothetical protein
MTAVRVPVTLACLAPARLGAVVTVMARSATSAAAHFHSPARRRAGDKSDGCNAGLVTNRWVRDDRTRPRRYYSTTDRAAGRVPGAVGWRSRRLWTAFWAEAVIRAAAGASG